MVWQYGCHRASPSDGGRLLLLPVTAKLSENKANRQDHPPVDIFGKVENSNFVLDKRLALGIKLAHE
jgi:hypothetical protein